jgi:hypothetical protein
MNAGIDDMSDEEYRALYDALSAGRTDRQFAALVGGPPGHAAWSAYRRGELKLSRLMKQKLRLEGDRDALPPTVVEIVESRVDPNAAVYETGIEESGKKAQRVLLIFGEEEMRLEGQSIVVHENALQPQLQTHKLRHDDYKSLAITRRTWEAANEYRKRLEITWDELLRRAMR